VQAGNFAIRVVDYHPGALGSSLTNTSAVLGEPSRYTHDPVWGTFEVDPFGPPYLVDQLLALGPGGWLTLELERPALNDPNHPHGLDLLVFGNAFLQLNSDFTTTSGSLGGTNTGPTTISISADGQTFHPLDSARVRTIDSWFPTDGRGDFSLAVDPTLGSADFAGLNLDGIRALYNGSGGGTGLDLSDALDDSGRNVILPWARFVRFEQITGEAQIDAVSAVGRPPAIFEDFSAPPASRGWKVAGDADLFAWDAVEGTLAVTWDSARTNSYFYLPLGTVLSRVDDFTVGFDLRLDSIQPGSTSGKSSTFQIALGLLRLEDALRTNFFRGVGVDAERGPRNVLEFDYFPDDGVITGTLSPTLVSSNNQFASKFEFPVDLPLEEWVRIQLRYTAADSTLTTLVLHQDAEFHPMQAVGLPAEFTDFRLNAVAVCSYSDAGQDPMFAGSVLARGTVDHVMVILPEPPVTVVSGGSTGEDAWGVRFTSQPHWHYTLERTVDFTEWFPVHSLVATNAAPIQLIDPAPAPDAGFYRVGATKP
jgi:hypothetical protein